MRNQQLHLKIWNLRQSRELQTDQPHLNPCKDDGVSNPEKISKHFKNKTLIGSSQHGLAKGKSNLTKVVPPYNRMTCSVNEGGLWVKPFRQPSNTQPLSYMHTPALQSEGWENWKDKEKTHQWKKNITKQNLSKRCKSYCSQLADQCPASCWAMAI